MPGTRVGVFPDNRPEDVIRKSLWRQWTIVIALVAWIMWFTTNHYNGKSIFVPLVVTCVGCGAGWIFGYKLGFGPVFASAYIFSAERVIEPKKWIPFDKLIDHLNNFRRCPECGGHLKQDRLYESNRTIIAPPQCIECKTVFSACKRGFQDGFELSSGPVN